MSLVCFCHNLSPEKKFNSLLNTLFLCICRLIYKCVMCDTVFTQKPLLYMHFDTHLAKQKVHVFKCPDCTKLYAQKGSMMEHIKVCLVKFQLIGKHTIVVKESDMLVDQSPGW